MSNYAYHRTSSKQQHLDRGITELTTYASEHDLKLFKNKVYTDQQTGKNFDRPAYQFIKEALEPGDTLIITELDRLGRNRRETMKEIQFFRDNNIRLMVLELPTSLMDISKMDNKMAALMLDVINNMMVDLYVALAEAELEKKEKRQREGIAAKKARGEWDDYGRPRKITIPDFTRQFCQICQTHSTVCPNQKLTLTQVRSLLKPHMSEATFFKYLALAKEENSSLFAEFSSLFYSSRRLAESCFASFCENYPKLLAEQHQRALTKKPMTTTELVRRLNLTSGTFYRFKERYEKLGV